MDFGTMWDRIPNYRRGWLFAHKTQVNWRETYEAHIFKADMLGFKKEDVRVQVLDTRMLEIRAKRKKEDVRVQVLDMGMLEIRIE